MSKQALFQIIRQDGNRVYYRFGQKLEGTIIFKTSELAANYIKLKENIMGTAWDKFKEGDTLETLGHNRASTFEIMEIGETTLVTKNPKGNLHTLGRETFEIHYKHIQHEQAMSAQTLRSLRPFPTAQMLALLGNAPDIKVTYSNPKNGMVFIYTGEY